MYLLQVFELSNRNGLKMTLTDFGGRVVSLQVPDRNGKLDDIVLGYDHVEQYINGNPYFGALIGPFANRIANGKFQLNGKLYHVPTNNGDNSLHGGPNGFHNVKWNVEKVNQTELHLSCFRSDGEDGFPGNLSVMVVYSLTDTNELMIDYRATTDQATVVSLTHHSFFNLLGAGMGDVLGHELLINAKYFCPVDKNLIPTGELKLVKGGAFDFTVMRPIGEDIDLPEEQLIFGSGYDHNWVLNKKSDELSLAAKVKEPTTGRVMEVFTTEPGLQFYSGNFLDGSDIGKGEKKYGYRSAFCLEAQHFPDSPNQPSFPSTALQPSEVYNQKTIYKFSVE
jgi:aldose 1-epimerase